MHHDTWFMKLRDSVTVKVLAIGCLVVVLLVPANLILAVIEEREETSETVVAEIGEKWGGAQTVTGPILVLPVEETVRNESGRKEQRTRYLYLLPDTLIVTGAVNPEIRYRGLYEAVVYNADLELAGTFARPDFEELGIEEKHIDWPQAFVALGITEMRGIRKDVVVRLGEAELPVHPGGDVSRLFPSGVAARLPDRWKGDSCAFEVSLNLNGSGSLDFTPVGKTTSVDLESSWGDPSFGGAFLPARREISDEGFTANWHVLHLNRNYPQAWIDRQYATDGSTFGVALILPADAYQKTLRMVKYAILFIALTFAAFFASEVLKRRRVHPVQYLLIGAALILFYTLLLSVAEHIGFGRSYAVSSVATILLVTCYARSVLRSGGLALLVGSTLTVLYGYLYIVLQLEDFALLLGSLGLFVILAVFMFMTRRVNWYESGRGPAGSIPAADTGPTPPPLAVAVEKNT